MTKDVPLSVTDLRGRPVGGTGRWGPVPVRGVNRDVSSSVPRCPSSLHRPTTLFTSKTPGQCRKVSTSGDNSLGGREFFSVFRPKKFCFQRRNPLRYVRTVLCRTSVVIVGDERSSRDLSSRSRRVGGDFIWARTPQDGVHPGPRRGTISSLTLTVGVVRWTTYLPFRGFFGIPFEIRKRSRCTYLGIRVSGLVVSFNKVSFQLQRIKKLAIVSSLLMWPDDTRRHGEEVGGGSLHGISLSSPGRLQLNFHTKSKG